MGKAPPYRLLIFWGRADRYDWHVVGLTGSESGREVSSNGAYRHEQISPPWVNQLVFVSLSR